MDDNTNNILVSVSPHTPGTIAGANNSSEGQAFQETSASHNEDRRGNGSQELLEDGNAEASVPDNARLLIRSLIDHYELSREQVAAVYDEYEKLKFVSTTGGTEPTPSHYEENSETSKDCRELRLHIVQEPTLARVATDTPGTPNVNLSDQQLQGEVNRLQSVVQSAMETYVSSPVATTPTRRSLNLPDDPLPSTFARELLQRDQSLVAQAIRKYLHQYSIPQREVVEKTGINQSHLSQHFTRGVPIKPAKRIKLYHWFEQDQLNRTGKLLTADGSITSVLESPKVEGYRRRPRWRWSPVATQILTEAFKKNRFPTREQRLELSRICNEAESAMNNGEPVPGPSGDTEGITEQRINTWFTNRRKGLVTPSPTVDSFGTIPGLILSPTATAPDGDAMDTMNEDTPTISTRSTSSLTLPINLATTTSGQGIPEGVSLTAPLALNLQALLNQLQANTNPMLGQNLGQILVGQIPQGLLLQSPQGTINLDAIAKQIQVVGGANATAVTPTTQDVTNDSDTVTPEENIEGDSSINEEEIITQITQTSNINS